MLTTEQIDAEALARWGDMKGGPLEMCRGFARAIEAEVRKQDEALIRQMLEALEQQRNVVARDEAFWYLTEYDKTITAARARLGEGNGL